MKPPPFRYVAVGSIDEALDFLQRYGDEARLLAGGQSLLPMLHMRVARPQLLVDINPIATLDYVRLGDGWLAVGALTRQREVERSQLVRERLPLLHRATLFIAHPQIRNRGTVGGSLAHAFPAAEYPAVAVALEAVMAVRGPRGAREVPASQFFLGYMTTALGPDEMLVEVRFPLPPPGIGWGMAEFARRHGDFALCGAVALLGRETDGTVSQARLTLFGVAGTPQMASEAMAFLMGERPSPELLQAVAQRAAQEVEVSLSDVHASLEYRRHLAKVMAFRALMQAAGLAEVS